MSDGSGRRARSVHSGAWWVWATALALSIATTTNPLLLLLVGATVVVTVLSRRQHAPWARSLRLYAGLAVFVVVVRVALHVLVGLKTSDTIVLPLPRVDLPSWAQGIDLLGPVGLGGLVGAALEGARLATMLLCFGGANALANPKRLLAATPAAVKDIAAATVIALSVSPQLVESVQRVRRARVLRGDARRRSRAKQVAMPVLYDTLDRSISLAAAMEARGYGARPVASSAHRRVAGVLTLAGSFAVCLGVYGTMQGSGAGGVIADTPLWMRPPVLALGLVMCLVGVMLAGRSMRRTRYRRDPWGALEWAVVGCGLMTLAAARLVLSAHPLARTTMTQPLELPQMPVALPLAVVPALLPAFFTPEPEKVDRAHPTRGDDPGSATPDASTLRGVVSR